MDIGLLDQAIELLAKANGDLQPELIAHEHAPAVLQRYARIEKLAGYGVAALSRKVDDPYQLARVAGTSVGKAREVVTTGKVMAQAPALADALQTGAISLDQAAQVASAEDSAPGVAQDLLKVAEEESFHVLKDKARAAKLEAEQHKGLAARQRAARSARHYSDPLGMAHIHLTLQPHVGAPLIARAEAEADRLRRAARKQGRTEPYECYLADAFAKMLAGKGKARTTRPELVVVVSHGVAQRGWKDVAPGEVCKIPGVGPIDPADARELARDAFVTGVCVEGKELRHIRRFSRSFTKELAIALELGDPPDFEGVRCCDCGNRFRNERDHDHPVAAGGESSYANNRWRCWNCHQAKTARDRKAGLLRPQPT